MLLKVQTLKKSDCEAVAVSSKEFMQTKEFLGNEHKENADEPLSKAKFEKIVSDIFKSSPNIPLSRFVIENSVI